MRKRAEIMQHNQDITYQDVLGYMSGFWIEVPGLHLGSSSVPSSKSCHMSELQGRFVAAGGGDACTHPMYREGSIRRICPQCFCLPAVIQTIAWSSVALLPGCHRAQQCRFRPQATYDLSSRPLMTSTCCAQAADVRPTDWTHFASYSGAKNNLPRVKD